MSRDETGEGTICKLKLGLGLGLELGLELIVQDSCKLDRTKVA